MESRNIKVKKATFLLLLFLLCSSAEVKPSVPDCCRQKSCSCRILELLRGMGNHAAGILTLGKRGSATATKAFQSRLYHLLRSSDNQAAGILTMGKRVIGLASELKEEVPSTQLTLGPSAMSPDPARACQAPPRQGSANPTEDCCCKCH
ncbi:hypothetical protein lerEdw1_001473 [Lerista edwardsae]|nr:hypothetical protein lerEdw1_001473 [Lerista edwardsae]